jgi:hypothetical protein
MVGYNRENNECLLKITIVNSDFITSTIVSKIIRAIDTYFCSIGTCEAENH